ncbi:unnamed protein product [Adineta steineri]|uniref:Uncharacterized protein n=1 Tax=Adineta steineri TaxID=433720 RepID=A0A814WUD3_9BILA|nr:unnamed protein product [Adineta steineri]CAF1296086.1 unnamed protein product [Adineta steineri]CAF1512488.1 unnamed protein product [Adineta steineri]CAF1647706.1 unnamed protein product [Adineta steineri]
MHCTGCDGYFCAKDFRSHREILSTEMEELVEEHNKLQEKINKATKENNANNPVFEAINAWEKMTIEKVRQTAEYVRQQANQLMNSKSMEITNEFKGFFKELSHLKETEDYVEHDLTRLKQKIDQFNEDLAPLFQGTLTEINKEESEKINWDRIIYVQEKAVEVERQQTSKKRKKSPHETEIFPQKQLLCDGRACTQCGKCTDWYRDSNKASWIRRDSASCIYYIIPTFGSYADHICQCR